MTFRKNQCLNDYVIFLFDYFLIFACFSILTSKQYIFFIVFISDYFLRFIKEKNKSALYNHDFQILEFLLIFF